MSAPQIAQWKRYQYQELQHPDNIRLLRIHPTDDLELPVHITLDEVSFGQRGYDALSYTWGRQRTSLAKSGTIPDHASIPKHEIFIDDMSLVVTENLHDALRQFR